MDDWALVVLILGLWWGLITFLIAIAIAGTTRKRMYGSE